MISTRSGSLLILIAGISSMLLVVCMAFLARMRSDGEEGALLVAEAQSRLMLHAAMTYLQEGSRLGWDDPATATVDEAFGWTDIRDGQPGPRSASGAALWSDASCFPEPGGRAARCPMHLLARPPYAIYPTWNPNPIDPLQTNAQRLAVFTAPDPRPVAITWADFSVPTAADLQPRLGSVNLAWFRVWREPAGYHDGVVNQTVDGRSDTWDTIALPNHHAIFIIACGAGGSNGYRDSAEAQADPDAPDALTDPAVFAIVRSAERILWYRVEWSPSVGQTVMDGERWGNRAEVAWHDRYPGGGMGMGGNGAPRQPPVDAGDPATTGLAQDTGREIARNLLGTFAWVQRLEREPPVW